MSRRFAAVVCLVSLSLAAAFASGDLRSRAIDLYDAGDYAGALPLLEQLDASGKADGPVLYRLAFARGRSGDRAGAVEAQRRAQLELEREYAAGAGLETAFYLSNAYRNLDRADDSRRVASETTARVESGALDVPDDPRAWFRVGKLYEDQGRQKDVVAWYRRAVEAMSGNPERHLGYLRWARRHLGNVAFSTGAYEESARQFAALVEVDPSSASDWDALATASARSNDWPAAVSAWERAVEANPADANRPRYCARLAAAAGKLAPLPPAAPDGRTWGTLSREDLEGVLSAQAAEVDAVAELWTEATAAGEPDPATRADLQARLDRAHRTFVAAGMEYALRRHPIRATAFSGGYAPLIFHGNRWQLPE